METTLTVGLAGILIFLAHLFAWFFERTKIPDVLMLIFTGFCIRLLLDMFAVNCPVHFGSVFASVTLVVILFEGGLGLSLNALKASLPQILSLTALNFFVTMGAVGFAVFYLTGLEKMVSFMFGAIVGSTAPTIIIPLVRQIKMRDVPMTILSIESAVSNVISFIVAFAMLDGYKSGNLRFGLMMGHIAVSFIVASGLGFTVSLIWSWLHNRVGNLQNSLFITFAFVFTIFGIAEILSLSGYIAALAFGISIGNGGGLLAPAVLRRRYTFLKTINVHPEEKRFFSEIVFLLRSFFFVYVGFSVQFTELRSVYFGFLLTMLIFLLRIPVTRLSISKAIHKRDVSLIAVMSPKGIAVVAMASLIFQDVGGDSSVLQNIANGVVICSIAMTSILVFFLTKTPLLKFYEWIFSGFGTSSNLR
ncbi:MAG: cation:proton antiporter [Proteobacteria bacterium]|nr:cation:proton antiporter [Pseudomonadota bacterium]